MFELWREKRRKRTGKRLSATYVDEVTATFYGTKRMELNHRDSVEMLREEEADGAPPRFGVDLDRGIVVVRPEDPRAICSLNSTAMDGADHERDRR